MNEHLPECPSKDVDCEVGDLGQCNCDEWHACICEALKACEKRIKESVYPSVVRISDHRIVNLDSLLDERP